jgi:hypothetical protein
MKLEIVLHCYIVEPERLAALHDLLHAVTFRKLLIINGLLCYINDNVCGEWRLQRDIPAQFEANGSVFVSLWLEQRPCDAEP